MNKSNKFSMNISSLIFEILDLFTYLAPLPVDRRWNINRCNTSSSLSITNPYSLSSWVRSFSDPAHSTILSIKFFQGIPLLLLPITKPFFTVLFRLS